MMTHGKLMITFKRKSFLAMNCWFSSCYGIQNAAVLYVLLLKVISLVLKVPRVFQISLGSSLAASRDVTVTGWEGCGWVSSVSAG